ncbi:Proline-rich receptor-like protein kinase PERK1 [Rhynchospora pubera]|uniref:non-specific serine/threonine protein kinase n=1 Tax=Rhynchospora pubera TaxID=906938 RepID=A0AAV8F646_9POAL|nr:Proline-rich receptor-like protein kinase PERK1 [Rhynchospora pubera]
MYKGRLADGRDVAVSLFSKNDAALRCFVAEMNILSHLHHRNVVMLIGHCVNNEQMIIVYEYAANRSLAFYLGEKAGSNLDWPTRYKIAHGFAKGLAYLHEDCHPRIVHGDIKPSNVLLTDSFEPKIAGFGFSTFLKDDEIDATVAIVGSSGYVDPEYLCSGRLTEKSDVFSFGVVLLQIITGKEPVIEQNGVEESLVSWATQLIAEGSIDGNYDKLMDSKLGKNYNHHEMKNMIECAAFCVRFSGKGRPKMSQVVQALEGLLSLDFLGNEDEDHNYEAEDDDLASE